MGLLGTLIPFVVLLGVLVTVHELGHFLVAKACGVKVLKFSIGFGPRIVSFTRGETEYQIAWIPLGGFVKMAGELPDEEVSAEDARRSFTAQPPWKKAAIVVAGPAFNLIFPVLLAFFILLGDKTVLAPRVGFVEDDLPGAKAGIRPGDLIVQIGDEPIVSFNDISQALAGKAGTELPIVVERDGQKMTFRLSPAQRLEVDPLEKKVQGVLGIGAARAPLLGVPPGSVAEAAGLKTFDRVVRINGKTVSTELEMIRALHDAQGELKIDALRGQDVAIAAQSIQVPQAVSVTVPRQSGESYAALGAESASLYVHSVKPDSAAAKAGLKAGDRLTGLDNHELLSWRFFQVFLETAETKPFTLKWKSGTEEKSATVAQVCFQANDDFQTRTFQLGLHPWLDSDDSVETNSAISGALTLEKVTISTGPVAAFTSSLTYVAEGTRKIGTILGKLIVGDVPMRAMGGPIAIAQAAGQAAEAGVDEFVALMVMLSVNLGLVNLLPIPVLDGFALLSALWEAIRRRPLSIRAREVANAVGLVVLALLMVRVFYNDITRTAREDVTVQQCEVKA